MPALCVPKAWAGIITTLHNTLVQVRASYVFPSADEDLAWQASGHVWQRGARWMPAALSAVLSVWTEVGMWIIKVKFLDFSVYNDLNSFKILTESKLIYFKL